jgi:hypothetical protein
MSDPVTDETWASDYGECGDCGQPFMTWTDQDGTQWVMCGIDILPFFDERDNDPSLIEASPKDDTDEDNEDEWKGGDDGLERDW